MNTLGLLEMQSVHDSMNIPKIEFIAYIYILLKISKIKKKYYNLGNKTFFLI